MGFDYRKLRGKIKEVCNTQANFAAAIGLGRTSLNQRLNNILDFSQSEMEKAAEILGFRKEDIPTYFFVPDVQKRELSVKSAAEAEAEAEAEQDSA